MRWGGETQDPPLGRIVGRRYFVQPRQTQRTPPVASPRRSTRAPPAASRAASGTYLRERSSTALPRAKARRWRPLRSACHRVLGHQHHLSAQHPRHPGLSAGTGESVCAWRARAGCVRRRFGFGRQRNRCFAPTSPLPRYSPHLARHPRPDSSRVEAC